jgi:hypothetical protein
MINASAAFLPEPRPYRDWTTMVVHDAEWLQSRHGRHGPEAVVMGKHL